MFTGSQGLLNIAAYTVGTHVLGPGYRSAVWVMGCPMHCKGCIAKDWIPNRKSILISPQKLAEILLKDPKVNGLTISGGEPFQQAQSLVELVRQMKKTREIDIICFSGHTLSHLQNDLLLEGAQELLSLVDVLIDGPYIEEKNDGIGLRGSSNQQIHFLTNRWVGYPFDKVQRSIEIRFAENNELFLVGIPPIGFDQVVDQAIERARKMVSGMVKDEWS